MPPRLNSAFTFKHAEEHVYSMLSEKSGKYPLRNLGVNRTSAAVATASCALRCIVTPTYGSMHRPLVVSYGGKKMINPKKCMTKQNTKSTPHLHHHEKSMVVDKQIQRVRVISISQLLLQLHVKTLVERNNANGRVNAS